MTTFEKSMLIDMITELKAGRPGWGWYQTEKLRELLLDFCRIREGFKYLPAAEWIGNEYGITL